jgi:hypothetical protein
MPHWSGAHGRLRAWLLATRAPRGNGGRGELHRGRRWATQEWSDAGDELRWRWLFALDDKWLGVGRGKGWSGFGCGRKWPRHRGLLYVGERREAGSFEL